MTDKLSAPLETDFDQCGAVLAGSAGPVIILASPYFPLVSPENFTDFQTPQSVFAMSFG